MNRNDWISTGAANRILDAGIDDRTFRDKYRDLIPWKQTPGGQFRWFRPAVEELAPVPKAG